MRDDFQPVAPPRYLSPIPEGTDISNAEAGARLQRLPLTPQGRLIAGVLEAKQPDGLPLYSSFTGQVPRRATKTTSVQNVLLGRCENIPGYQVVSTAQDGTRASEFMADLMDTIEQHAEAILAERNEEVAESWDDPEHDPPEMTMKAALAELGIRQLYKSQGREYIRWVNGSRWKSVPPEASKLRGKGVKVVWFDEGGELDPAESGKLMAGALPMLDTNPDAQIIITGTPGEVRAGAFWTDLEKARANPERYGICDYSGDDFVDVDDEANWWLIHPGLACGLTSIKVLRERHDKMDAAKFGMEYLCIWPMDTTTTALDVRKWEVTGRPARVEPPGNTWVMAFDVDPSGLAAAVSVAWIDDAGNPWVQIMRHRGGTSGWMVDYLARAMLKFPRLKVGFDSIGQNVNVADDLRAKKRIRSQSVKALTMKDVGAGTAKLSQSLENMTIHHADHPGFDASIKNSQWRESGGTRLFRSNGGEITCLRSAVAALALVNKERRTSTDEAEEAGTGLPSAAAL